MSPTVITLIFLAFAIIMFVTEKIPLGLTSMIVCIGLVITGVLSVSDAFNGFINSNVILFVAMFIVGGALFETGMANEIGSLVTKFAKTERSLIIAIMVIFKNRTDVFFWKSGAFGMFERISFQYRYGSSSYSGCNWNCSEVRV